MCDVMASAPTDGFLSRMTVLSPARAVYSAHVQPAGPPPTIATSHSTTSDAAHRRHEAAKPFAQNYAKKRCKRRLETKDTEVEPGRGPPQPELLERRAGEVPGEGG